MEVVKVKVNEVVVEEVKVKEQEVVVEADQLEALDVQDVQVAVQLARNAAFELEVMSPLIYQRLILYQPRT